MNLLYVRNIVPDDEVDHIKKVISTVFDLANEISAISKNFSFPALAGLALKFPIYRQIVDEAKLALGQFKSFTPAKAKIVNSFIKDEFDIDNKELETKLETAIDFIEEGYGLALDIYMQALTSIDYVKRVKLFVANWNVEEKPGRQLNVLRKVDVAAAA